MSNQLKDFHHYKGGDLSRFEKVERKVIQLILETKISDNDREDSQAFEFMHASGCMQIGRLLAQKRNLDIDLASIACMLHDIYVVIKGKYSGHGPNGGAIAQKILEEAGGFSEDEIKTVVDAISHHSEKEIYSDNPYVELVKDVDVFDCSLYKNAEGFYRLHKSLEVFEEYVKRIKKVREELGLPPENVFR